MAWRFLYSSDIVRRTQNYQVCNRETKWDFFFKFLWLSQNIWHLRQAWAKRNVRVKNDIISDMIWNWVDLIQCAPLGLVPILVPGAVAVQCDMKLWKGFSPPYIFFPFPSFFLCPSRKEQAAQSNFIVCLPWAEMEETKRRHVAQ